MLEQVSNGLLCVAQFTSGGSGATGLTVTCSVYKSNTGTWTTVVTSQSATEIARGFYSYLLSSGNVDIEALYLFIFTTTGTADLKDVGVGWAVGKAGVEDLDAAISSRLATSGYTVPPTTTAITNAVWDEPTANHQTAATTGKALTAAGSATDPLLNTVPGSYASGTAGAALGRIGSGQITVTNPVATDGTISVVRGDDYSASDSRGLDFTDTSAGWPDLTGATITVTFRSPVSATAYTGSVVTPTGSSKKVRLELTSAQTRALTVGAPSYRFDVQATLSAGRIVTLVRGTVTVLEDATLNP